MLKEKGLFKNKKADAVDIVLFITLLIFLAISFIIGIYVNAEIGTIIEETEQFNYTSSPQDDIVSTLNTINTTTTQRAFVMVIALLIIAMMVSSFLVKVHPVWIFIWIIFLGISIFTCVYLANIYQQFIEIDAIAGSIAGQQNMINYIMNHMVLITLAVGALSMIITFSRAFAPVGATQDL